MKRVPLSSQQCLSLPYVVKILEPKDCVPTFPEFNLRVSQRTASPPFLSSTFGSAKHFPILETHFT